MRLLATSVLLVLLVTVAVAGELQEFADAASENLELSLVGGSFGWGGAGYWPMAQWRDVTFGPFVAVAADLTGVGGGCGAKIDVEWDLVDNFVNFFGAGIYLERGSKVSPDYWLGRSFKLK